MEHTIDTEAAMESFCAFLKEKGMRKTPERFEILRVALSLKEHFDTDMLYNALEKEGYHVSRATVYSTLDLLTQSGIVRKLLFDTHQARFETAGPLHSHLVCTSCGKIREINSPEGAKDLSETVFPGFTTAYVSTCVYGICDECLKSEMTQAGNCRKTDLQQ